MEQTTQQANPSANSNNSIVVGIAEMKYSLKKEILVTQALGSCIGISFYDSLHQIGAMLHFMLPDSSIDGAKAVIHPFMFADTGVTTTLKILHRLGSKKKDLVVKMAGGANIMDPRGIFDIGKRNVLALKKILWKYNLIVKGRDIGGNTGRNLKLDLNTGFVTVRYNGKLVENRI